MDYRSRPRFDVSFGLLVFGFYLSVFFGATFKICRRYIPECLSYQLCLMVIGTLYGFAGYKFDLFFVAFLPEYVSKCTYLLRIIFPLFIFRIGIYVNLNFFIKCIGQIMIIIILWFLSSLVIGFAMYLIQNNELGYSANMLYTFCLVQIYPLNMLRDLKAIGLNCYHLATLLAGEILFQNLISSLYADILKRAADMEELSQMIGNVLLYTIVGSILYGFFTAYISVKMIRIFEKDVTSVLTVSFVSPIIASVTGDIMGLSEVIVLLILGLYLNREREKISMEMDIALVVFWDSIMFVINCHLFFLGGITLGYFCLRDFKIIDITIIAMAYIVTMIFRLLMFFITAIIIGQMSYKLSMKQLMLAVWGAVPGIPNLWLMMMIFYDVDNYNFFSNKQPRHETRHLLGSFFLLFFINRPLIRLFCRIFEVSKISVAKELNMNNCMIYILKRRSALINVLKMDRFLTDANWTLIHKCTKINHPYSIDMAQLHLDGKLYKLGAKSSICPDCRSEFVAPPTEKELEEIERDADWQIIKTLKISYVKQYETGSLSKLALSKLLGINDMVVETKCNHIDGIKKVFNFRGNYLEKIRTYLAGIAITRIDLDLKPPRRKIRRYLYKFITSLIYELIMGVIVASYLAVVSIVHIKMWRFHYIYEPSWSNVLKGVFVSLFLIEFIVKIFGFSFMYISDGFRIYFRSLWSIFDFFMLIICICDIMVCVAIRATMEKHHSPELIRIIGISSNLLCTLRIFFVFKFMNSLRWKILPFVIKCIDNEIDHKMAIAFDVGHGFIKGWEEVYDSLDKLVDHPRICQKLKKRVLHEIEATYQELSIIQRDRPWVAVTVKTHHAIKTTLYHMTCGIEDLKSSGWLDPGEYTKIVDCVLKCHKDASSLNRILPSEPKVIFDEVIWMSDDETKKNFLFKNAILKTFFPGDYICSEGVPSAGIFVVASGLLHYRFVPDDECIGQLEQLGALPMADYVPADNFREPKEDYIVAGNCLGELSMLTERPYNSTVTAIINSQAFFIPEDILKRSMASDQDSIYGLEARIWKACALRLAIPLLLQLPSYKTNTQEKLRSLIEKAFVPDLKNLKTFTNTSLIEDIILIQGKVTDIYEKEYYIAPCHIPRTMQKLVFPQFSNTEGAVETRLLLIPTKDVEPFEILIAEEERQIRTMGLTDSDSAQIQKSIYKISVQSKASVIIKRQKRQNRRTERSMSFAQSQSNKTDQSEGSIKAEPEEEQ